MSKRKNINDYVCPFCFRRINKCICDNAPENLIQIDENIQDHIRILNEKKYVTETCCESHYMNNGNLYGLTDIYIAFVLGLPDNVKIPHGFKIMKNRRIISFIYPKRTLTEKEFNDIKTQKLKELLDFSKELPERNGY